MRQCLRRKQIVGIKFFRQKPICSNVVDFFTPTISLAVEVDGCSHDNRGGYNQRRDEFLTSLGVKVLRFTEEEVRQDV